MVDAGMLMARGWGSAGIGPGSKNLMGCVGSSRSVSDFQAIFGFCWQPAESSII
jgi:hypothetical protein